MISGFMTHLFLYIPKWPIWSPKPTGIVIRQ